MAKNQKPIKTSMGSADTGSVRHQLGVSILPTIFTFFSFSRVSNSGSYRLGGLIAAINLEGFGLPGSGRTNPVISVSLIWALSTRLSRTAWRNSEYETR